MATAGKIGVAAIDRLRDLFEIIGTGGVPDLLAADEGVKLVYDVGRLLGSMSDSEGTSIPGTPFTAGISLAAVAAQYSRWTIRNPQDSGVDLFLEDMWFESANMQLAFWWGLGADMGTASVERPRDLASAIAPKAVVTQENAVTAPTLFAFWTHLTGGTKVIPVPVRIIPPGSAMFFSGNVVNVGVTAQLHWRELIR